MYSRGILGSCFWNRFFMPVSRIMESREPSLVNTRNSINPCRSSITAGFSFLIGTCKLKGYE